MATKKKIEIVDSSDDENLDIKTEETEQEQDSWAEVLDDENQQETTENEEADATEQPEAIVEADDSEVEDISAEEGASEVEGDETPENDAEITDENESEATEPEQATEEEAESAEATKPEVVEDSEQIDEVVDSIVREDSDKVIRAEDEARARQFAPPVENRSLVGKIKHIFSAWWHHKRLRYGTLFGLLLILIIAAFIPFTRYGMLNLAGVRVSSSMKIVDSVSGLPLKNIPVVLQNKEARSDDTGNISFSGLKLGDSILKVDKRGYAPLEKHIILGWGSNPIGEQGITATGAQYKFVLTDWLSGKPVAEAEATSGEDVGQSDAEGHITLTVGEDKEDAEVILSAKDYREVKLRLSDINQEETPVKMVAAKKHAFVSKRSGKYDLFSIDVDGKNEKLLLAATGKEREVPFALPHQTKDVVAYISSRDGDVNKDNFILDGLFIVNTTGGEVYKVTRSEQLQVIGWIENKLIFVAVVEGTSTGNSGRSKLISYDLDTKERKDLASANYFNDVKIVGKDIYYAVSSYAVPASQAKLYSINADGTNKKTVVDTQVWTIIRKDFDTLVFNAVDLQWFEKIGTGDAKKLDVEPAQKTSRTYTVSPDNNQALWVDVRDGKGVLLRYQSKDKSEQAIQTKAGLSDPVYWLDNTHFIYQVNTSQETADYVMSVDGGEAQKIADVSGNRSRYFY